MKKLFLMLLCAVVAAGGDEVKKSAPAKKSRKAVQPAGTVIDFVSSYDKKPQKAMIYVVPGKDVRPLIVALHTWSVNYLGANGYVNLAKKYKTHLIAPDFRGRNTVGNPLSMGSDAAVADIVSAVEWMKKKANVDPNRIYIIGGSGGGHMALLMAGRHPEIWAGVSAWCPISDLKKWCTFHKGKGYGAHIIRNLKGDPRSDAKAAEEAARRSPVTWLAKAKDVAVDIGTGIHDGHKGSVPISEAFYAYNCIAAPGDKVSEKEIDFMVKNEKAPAGTPVFKDPGYGKRKIHYRKTSGNVRITIFEGGHNILSAYGVDWLLKQKKGQKAVWQSAQGSGKAEQLTK
jgi:pimeloyl-ACP methyl ester carboxylesterase